MDSDHIAKNIPFTVVYDGQSDGQVQVQETIIRSSEELAAFFGGSPSPDIDAAWDMDTLIAVALGEPTNGRHPTIQEITVDKSDTDHPSILVSYSIAPPDGAATQAHSAVQIVKCQHLEPSATASFRTIGLEQQIKV